MEDQDEIIFRRFPAEKQEQVRQLIGWTKLMGLSGDDLVSIGGKLNRLSAQQELSRNKEIAQSMWHRIREYHSGKFQYTDPESGHKWLIESKWASGYNNHITVSQGRKTVTHELEEYHCGTSADAWVRRVLVNIHYGDLDLEKILK
jgi:hypothetical protein